MIKVVVYHCVPNHLYMSYVNPSRERRIAVYPSASNYKIVVASAATKSMKLATIINKMIGKYINDNLSLHQQKELINFYDRMTPEEKKSPAKCYEIRERHPVEYKMVDGRMQVKPKIW